MGKTLKLKSEDINKIISTLNFRHEDNTVIAVVQDYNTNEVLMVGNMNKEAVIKTLTTGYLHFWSLSRKKLWLKGETSGNYQIVKEIRVDCDADALLFKVKSLGPICHTGNRTCFFRDYSQL
ncbi:phosphoribosyl-AMP cyclohydrolase [Sulfolobus sp. A20-N-F6]|uniref:phosphoribosyl-AMP cyclohydrolase n=1 Tax=Sulfolobaceae TaxID=118883 RepID=UPI0008461FDD|nr:MULTISPECIES: phosphoribosyl-AMP cyclohydrolase [unclassified Sulfolobus]TRM76472.1 phosphoribosyl-AMP cyclohydrolase [Sulfolobus sp. E5]TRM76715.1 phosphoribosyl-AMP cyclohydrolase [Sulfolobus sp. A20-N-F8]TRM82766.1 phosphoribosyl-AMP cyclohydrolase [Sulfolobus sp. A20-N-F6]TRM84561.1 phosphoribosyl-AMP cyclohydrolase [Sulfolobus sp. F3]TRM87759.1 phosphoribosyl-AMP cyclohydrolase [Sulfolobus sp. C3]TRM93366.1 phosphoribosyl-AMP cyclohydrolase [Sulfolobus sp. A20-N-G8]TRM98814.1 phospho